MNTENTLTTEVSSEANTPMTAKPNWVPCTREPVTPETEVYASTALKVGDRVGVRVHSDITPGTVIKATATKAVILLHEFRCVNLPNSGAPDAMKCDVGGFCAHFSGIQRNEIDLNSERGTVTVTFRKGDKLNGQTGIWRTAGYPGGLGKLPGVIYRGFVCNYDFNF